MSEAPYVLDGLHITRTRPICGIRRALHRYRRCNKITCLVFLSSLGFGFAPRIKDLKDRKPVRDRKPSTYPLLEPLIGDAIEQAAITSQWTELMRLKASIEVGSVHAVCHSGASSLRQALAMRSRAPCGRSAASNAPCHSAVVVDPDLRQRSHAGLTKARLAILCGVRSSFTVRANPATNFENQSFERPV